VVAESEEAGRSVIPKNLPESHDDEKAAVRKVSTIGDHSGEPLTHLDSLAPYNFLMLDQLRQNLSAVRDQIATACRHADRNPDEVTLVCVTKYADIEWVHGLYELGERHFGESRPQQLSDRTPLFANDVHWHLIGSLQSNKVRSVVQHAHTIHSVDSTKLLERVDRIAGEEKATPNVFLQVNVSDEDTKHGWSVASFQAEKPADAQLKHARLVGLMTMAPRVDDTSQARPYFATLRQLDDQFAKLPSLSMGMSNDFAAAIAEGATHVRVGSRLFHGLSV
jgi:hypothetical protein